MPSVIQTLCTQAIGKCFWGFLLNYAPLIWMFYKKTIYLEMQKIHHKTLRIIYQSDESYENLLNLDNSVSLHKKTFKGATKMYFMHYSRVLIVLVPASL